MARNIYCCKCKLEKEPGYENSSYCKSCKHKGRSEARAKARAEKGLPEWGSGKKRLDCPDCGSVKQDPRQQWCNPCRSKRSKEWTVKTGRVIKNQTGLCPCGAPRAENQPYYCSPCKAADSRRYREYMGHTQKERDRFKKWYKANKDHIKDRRISDAFYRIKLLARSALNNAVVSGALVRNPCSICGTTENVEGHHEDYTKPLDVIWLCTKHHNEHHRNESLTSKET